MGFNYYKEVLLWIKSHAEDINRALDGKGSLSDLFHELSLQYGSNVRNQFAWFLYEQVEVNAFDYIDIQNQWEYSGIFEYTPITNIEFPSNLTIIPENAFRGCSSLKTIRLPNSLDIIGQGAFNESGLRKISIPSAVHDICYSAFQNCGDLEEVKINEGVKELGPNAFYGCPRLKKIVIPKSVDCIYGNVFANSGLEEVTFLGDTNLAAYADGDRMFQDCPNLRQVTLPDTWGHVPFGIFQGSNIENFSCPKSCEYIYENAFRDCKNLKKVSVNDGCKCIKSYAFLDSDNFLLELPQSIITIGGHAIGEAAGNTSKSNNTKVKIRGLNKEQAKEYFDNQVHFELKSTKSRFIKALV